MNHLTAPEKPKSAAHNFRKFLIRWVFNQVAILSIIINVAYIVLMTYYESQIVESAAIFWTSFMIRCLTSFFSVFLVSLCWNLGYRVTSYLFLVLTVITCIPLFFVSYTQSQSSYNKKFAKQYVENK